MVLDFTSDRRSHPRCAASLSPDLRKKIVQYRKKKQKQTLPINIFSSTHIKDAASALISARRFQHAWWHNKQVGADCEQVLATELTALTANKLGVL